MKRLLICMGILTSNLSCQTTAESNFELNRRSGLDIGQDLGEQRFVSELAPAPDSLQMGTESGKPSHEPRIAAPKVQKIWVTSQPITETTWLQGTWIYVQVEKPRWLAGEEAK